MDREGWVANLSVSRTVLVHKKRVNTVQIPNRVIQNMGINAHASYIYVPRVFIHVLHLICTLEGPAKLASSLEVSLEEN
jgi:hypothetical protein